MVTASDSSANTVPGERTGLGVLSFWCTTEKAGAAVREWKKKRRKKKVQEQKERRKKQYSRRMNRKKNSCEEKGRKTVTDRRKDTNGCERAKSTEKQTKPEKSKTAESEAKETELKTSERKQPEKEKVSDKLSRFWNRCKNRRFDFEISGKTKEKAYKYQVNIPGIL